MAYVSFLKLGKVLTFRTGIRSDRRKHPRLKSHHLARFVSSEGSAKEELSNLINLSEGGLQLFSREKLESNVLLKIAIHVPELARDIEAVGKVVWCRSNKRGIGYSMGVAFVDVTEDNQSLIRDAIALLVDGASGM